MKKKVLRVLSVLLVLIVLASATTYGCYLNDNRRDPSNDLSWQNKGYDLTVPELGKDGWYMVFEDNFNGNSLNQDIVFGDRYEGNGQIWAYSPHYKRWGSDSRFKPNNAIYWCPEMVEVKDGNLVIHSQYHNDHECDGTCPKKGRFTGGIDSANCYVNENGTLSGEALFSQAFGYYECRAKLPNANGVWAAFWLQSFNQSKLGNKGEDATEIDVFESAFRRVWGNYMGHALLWDGYGKEHKTIDYIGEVPNDLYDGYHTYAVKWTPEYYVFYIDGVPHWATNEGGVSKVKEFIRLTCDIDAGNGSGPYGENIGKFNNFKKSPKGDFMVDYVKVWQNENYEQYIKDDDFYVDKRDINK